VIIHGNQFRFDEFLDSGPAQSGFLLEEKQVETLAMILGPDNPGLSRNGRRITIKIFKATHDTPWEFAVGNA
jgi:hypothetical protein